MKRSNNQTNLNTCNNCGMVGHAYRECRHPVLSYGHILFRDDLSEPKILMIQRKDSLCYIELIRGKYDPNNHSYIIKLLSKCTRNERRRMIDLPYQELWGDLWCLNTKEKMSSRFRKDYLKGFQNYSKVCDWSKLVREIDPTLFYEESEWEFPKGRRNPGETNKECGAREFQEETNYIKDDYTLIDNIAPIDESYVGENRVRYKHVYYIGKLTNLTKKATIDLQNHAQSHEIKNILWLTRSEALSKLRDYQTTKRHIIQKIFLLIDRIYDQDPIYKLI